jgi:carboxyl-terminal processing protease
MKWSLLFVFIISTSVWGQFFSSKKEKTEDSSFGSLIPGRASYSKEMVLGNILKGALENMHFTKKKVDDKLSEKAFDAFIERLDYGKQFLLQSDVDKLKKFSKEFDDELVSGKLKVIEESTTILNNRIKEIETFTSLYLSKPLNFSAKESLETDPKKRKFQKSLSDLQSYWAKSLKYDVMSRVLDLKDEQNGTQSEAQKKKNKNKKSDLLPTNGKKLSDSELEAKAREKTAQSYKKLFQRMLSETTSDKHDKFYNSITKIFDPHTNYLIPDDKADFDIDMSGKLEGIGALLREDGSYIKVEKIIPGSASWKQKELKEEDIIMKVGQTGKEPVDVVDMPLRDAVKLIRGPKGSTVHLTVKKPNGLIKTIPIVRDVVEIEESYVKSTVIEKEGVKEKFGYIFVPKFYRDFNDRNGRNCTDDVRQAIDQLKEKNVEGIILDLRNNGGGALEDARLMSGLFIKRGPIVQVKAHTGTQEILMDTDNKIHFEKPVIVLINKFSASASEIVAAALQDYGRAIVVGGEHSHGKGTVQAVVDLDGYVSPMAKMYSPMGALKITIQMFYRINGASTQYKGVHPDIVLPDTFEYLESGEKHLDYSIPWGKERKLSYDMWPQVYNMSKIKENSKKRVEKDSKFSKIKESINWYKKKKDQSLKSLVMTEFLAEREEIKKKTDSFNIDEEENKSIKISSLEPNKLKDPAQKEKFDEFAKSLKADPYIDESINIFNDVLH